jgi:lysophospholipase L1-like esterase
MFRHANGYSLLACDGTLPANNLMSRYYKQTGSSITAFTDTSFPGRGQYNSYNPTTSTWSVTLTNSGQALITINGRAVSAPIWTTSLGDIFEVAFVWGPGNSAGSCSISDVLIEQNSDPLGRAEIAEVRIFGDSTSDYLLGAWQDDFKDMLDHTHGVKLSTITNFAVSGTNSFDVVTSMDANGFGNAYYVVIAIGTNDIQGGSALSSTEANISGAISRVNSAGRVPVVVIPYMWYGQAQAIAGRGQASLNYDQGARYRARIARLCAELGAVMVDPTRELPEPKPGYVTSDTFNDPLVRDNIHQSALGNKLYAWAIARAIASYHSQLFGYKDYSCGIPADWMRNGWTRGGSTAVLITDSGRVSIQGNFAAGTTTVNTVIMNLPRWARPAVAMTFPCSCNGTGNLVLIKVDTTGDVSLITSPASMTIPDLNTISFNAA